MEEKLINIQEEIEKILKEEFNEVIENNAENLLISLLINDKLEKYSINELINKINESDKE